LGKVITEDGDTPLYFCSYLFSCVAELRSMFAIQMSEPRDKPVAALRLEPSTSSTTSCPSSNNRVVTSRFSL
jgi:hypothetical protein